MLAEGLVADLADPPGQLELDGCQSECSASFPCAIRPRVRRAGPRGPVARRGPERVARPADVAPRASGPGVIGGGTSPSYAGIGPGSRCRWADDGLGGSAGRSGRPSAGSGGPGGFLEFSCRRAVADLGSRMSNGREGRSGEAGMRCPGEGASLRRGGDVLTQNAIEELAERIERAYRRRQPHWRLGLLEPAGLVGRGGGAAADAPRRPDDPGRPGAVRGRPADHLAVVRPVGRPDAGDGGPPLPPTGPPDHPQAPRRAAGRGPAGRGRVRRGEAIEAVLRSRSRALSPLGRFIAAYRAGRPDLAEPVPGPGPGAAPGLPALPAGLPALLPAAAYPGGERPGRGPARRAPPGPPDFQFELTRRRARPIMPTAPEPSPGPPCVPSLRRRSASRHPTRSDPSPIEECHDAYAPIPPVPG